MSYALVHFPQIYDIIILINLKSKQILLSCLAKINEKKVVASTQWSKGYIFADKILGLGRFGT